MKALFPIFDIKYLKFYCLIFTNKNYICFVLTQQIYYIKFSYNIYYCFTVFKSIVYIFCNVYFVFPCMKDLFVRNLTITFVKKILNQKIINCYSKLLYFSFIIFAVDFIAHSNMAKYNQQDYINRYCNNRIVE